MKQSFDTLVRILFVLLLFVPAPLAVVGTTPAVAESSVEALTDEPAVMLPEDAAEAEEDPWTTRFLAPAVVVIAVLSVGSVIAYYVVGIRGRYRVVE